MARHRNVRNMNFDDDYEGYNDVYGHSVEDNYCVSPSASQYLYNRGEPNQISAFFSPEEADIQEEPDEEDKSGLHKVTERVKSITLESAVADLVPEEEILLKSCLEEIQNVMGESTPDGVIISEILRAKFNVEKALDACLRGAIEPEHVTEDVKLQTRRDDRSVGTQSRGITSGLTGDVFIISNRKIDECGSPELGQLNGKISDEVKVSSLPFELFAKAHFEKVNAKNDAKPIELRIEPLISGGHENLTLPNSRRRLIAVESIMAMQAQSSNAADNVIREEQIVKPVKLVTTEDSTSNVLVDSTSEVGLSQVSQHSSNKITESAGSMNLLFALQKSAKLKGPTNQLLKSVKPLSVSGTTSSMRNTLLNNSNSEIGTNKAKTANIPNLLFAAQKRLLIKPSPRECTLKPADTQGVQEPKCLDESHTSLESPPTGIHQEGQSTHDIKITSSNGAHRIRFIPEKRLYLDINLIKIPSSIGKRIERSSLSHRVKPLNLSSSIVEIWSILRKHFPEKLFKFDVLSPDAVVAHKLEKPHMGSQLGNPVK